MTSHWPNAHEDEFSAMHSQQVEKDARKLEAGLSHRLQVRSRLGMPRYARDSERFAGGGELNPLRSFNNIQSNRRHVKH
jgi:hypothetical protein